MKVVTQILLLLIFVGLCLTSKAQANLVPNPSFEAYTDCPTGVPDLEGKCNNWTSFRGSPDYFNNCSSNAGFKNPFGYQVAHTGQGYTGVLLFQRTFSNAQEQVGVELLSQLEIGIKYHISFFVSSAYTYLYANIASNKIGVLFTTYQYFDSNWSYSLPNNCQVFTNTVITDTVNWVKVSGSFVADSAYKYLIIGGFFDDKHIDTIHFPYQVVPQVSYYYLDDVCVSTDSVYTETWTGAKGISNPLNYVSLFPNPSTGLVHLESSLALQTIKVSNSRGEELLHIETANMHHQILDLSSFSKGIYYCKIELQDGYYTIKKIIINY